MATDPLQRDLARIVGSDHAVAPVPASHLSDATEGRGVRGEADVLVIPGSAEEVAEVVAHCYDGGIAVTPRGGGTGFAGGAVPAGGVVLSLARLTRVLALEPERWRMHVQAGVSTAHVRRLARENGLLFGPDPGAAESSQIGGNVATNAGGPHAYRYGTTGAWVTGLEAVLAPGELVRSGGALRKDAAGYDLAHLLVGSEGTLGVVTAAWLRLIPAPEATLPLVAVYATAAAGCAAISQTVAAGVQAAALEYLDGATLAAAGVGFPGLLAERAGFMVIAEADGSRQEARRVREELREALAPEALTLHAPESRAEVDALWRWRDGVSLAVSARRGGKLSEDVGVPPEHLERMVAATLELGARHRLEACSWGHAGDGNLHATFMLDSRDREALERAREAAEQLFDLALSLGGTVSGEHGAGIVKRAALARQLSPAALRAQRAIKRALDPKGLLNPGTKLPDEE